MARFVKKTETESFRDEWNGIVPLSNETIQSMPVTLCGYCRQVPWPFDSRTIHKRSRRSCARHILT
jgi:hypothetical protein